MYTFFYSKFQQRLSTKKSMWFRASSLVFAMQRKKNVIWRWMAKRIHYFQKLIERFHFHACFKNKIFLTMIFLPNFHFDTLFAPKWGYEKKLDLWNLIGFRLHFGWKKLIWNAWKRSIMYSPNEYQSTSSIWIRTMPHIRHCGLLCHTKANVVLFCRLCVRIFQTKAAICAIQITGARSIIGFIKANKQPFSCGAAGGAFSRKHKVLFVNTHIFMISSNVCVHVSK